MESRAVVAEEAFFHGTDWDGVFKNDYENLNLIDLQSFISTVAHQESWMLIQPFLEYGEAAIQTKQYESAYWIFSQALIRFENEPRSFSTNVLIYKRLVESAASLKAHKQAVMAALELISLYPMRIEGYRLAMQLSSRLNDYWLASMVSQLAEQEGLPNNSMIELMDMKEAFAAAETPLSYGGYNLQKENAKGTRYNMMFDLGAKLIEMALSYPPDDIVAEKTSSSSASSWNKLPWELQLMILDYIPFFERRRMKTVSKHWNQLASKSLEMATSLDFGYSERPITLGTMHEITSICQLNVEEIILRNIHRSDTSSCILSLLRGREKPVFRQSSQPRHKALDLPNLRALHIKQVTLSMGMVLSKAERDQSPFTYALCDQLQELSVPIERSSDIWTLMQSGLLKKLKKLDLEAQYSLARYRMPCLGINEGGRPYHDEYSSFPFSQPNEMPSLDISSITSALQFFPNLRHFACTYVRLLSDSECEFDIAKYAPQLEVVDLSWSELQHTQSILRLPKCRSLRFRHFVGESLRPCVSGSGGRYYSRLTSAAIEREGDAFELERVQKLDLSWYSHSKEQLIDVLARCNADELTELDLQYSVDIDFTAAVFGKHQIRNSSISVSDFMSNPTAYGRTRLPEGNLSVIELILILFPRLRKLKIGYNATVRPFVFEKLTTATNLEYLDISGSPNATDDAVAAYLRTNSTLKRLVACKCIQLDIQAMRRAAQAGTVVRDMEGIM